MSTKKGSEVSSVVVGRVQNRTGPRTRLAILVVCGLALLAVLGFGGYAMYKYFAHKQDGSTGKSAQPQKPNYVSKGVVPPTSVDLSGDQAALDKEIQNTSDDTARATLFLKKADLVIVNKGYNDEALKYAQKAEDLAPSMQSAFELATIYEAKKDKAGAIKYYSLYLSRMTPEYRQANPGFYEHYQQVVQELQKS